MNLEETKNRNIVTINLNDVIYSPDNSKYLEERSQVLGKSIKDVLVKEYGINVDKQYEELLYGISKCFVYPFKDNKAVVLPVEPGVGKSTAVNEFLKYMTTIDQKFGCIVVKERKEDVKKLAYDLSGQAYPLYGFDDDCLEGKTVYRRSVCNSCNNDNCRLKKNYREQKKYPILVMTTERFKQHLQYERNMEYFSRWYSLKDGLEYKRDILIIDEKPCITINESITLEELLEIKRTLNSIKVKGVLSRERKQLVQYIDELIDRGVGTRKPENLSISVNPINESYVISNRLKSYFNDIYQDDDISIIQRLEHFINKGAVVKKCGGYNNDTWIFRGMEYMDYSKLEFEKTLILDGTALYDTDYKRDHFNVLNFKRIRNYENLYINICSNLKISKKKSQEQNQLYYKNIADDITTIAGESETLILTYKEVEDELRDIIFSDPDGSRNIYLDHFGNVKGSNRYKNCSKIFCYGLLSKGDDYYAAKAMSIYDKTYENLGVVPNCKNYELKFNEQEIQEVFTRDQFVDLVQSILRIKIRSSTREKVEVYIFVKNTQLKNMLQEYFRGCTIQDWVPEKIALNDESVEIREAIRISNIIKDIFAIKKEISKKELREKLGIKNPQQLRSKVSHSIVVTTLKDLGIIEENKRYVKAS